MNGFSEFCVRDIGQSEDGRREIQLAERGNKLLLPVQSSLAVCSPFSVGSISRLRRQFACRSNIDMLPVS